MLSMEPLGLDSVMLDEVRAYLRVDENVDDSSLAASILAAIGHAEQFTRQALLRRVATEIVTAGSGWQILQALPVQAITDVTGIPAEGATFALPASAWELKISSQGEAYFRVLQPASAGRVEISLIAGLAADWASLPESLRLGLLRLAGHFYNNRDSASDDGPPAAALALLQPWRRMRVA
jgi:uncharacterized phiE125 gp8 family phage protein